jgi:selenocysteine-specific elongation factor
MSEHVVVGTAGHVDHGKTALVKLLTGVDTDRWEEEKRRGITIDLGFAQLPLGDDLTASVVDVPGHEDFVRNMVAGATGIDVALLVLAADEGVMPQTREHLAILEFLGVKAGVIALTKIDLVTDQEWVDLVEADVQELLDGTAIAWEPPVRCSAESALGRDALVAAIRSAAQGAAHRSVDDLFRLPVDRAFSVPGAGTVVTGTTWSGTVAVGDRVRILPGETTGRVRSVEVHGDERKRAEPGRRTALAIPGVDRDAAPRGSVVVAGEGWHATSALDVWLTLLPDAEPLSQRSRVRLHLGTAEVFARLTPIADTAEPGVTTAVRLRLDEPVVARWGDRGVIRTYSPMRTIGGCVVVDPFPPRRPRRPRGLEGKGASEPAQRVLAFVVESGRDGLPMGDLPVRVGTHPKAVDAVIDALGHEGEIHVVDGRIVAAAVIADRVEHVRQAVEAFHATHPLEPGVALEALRAAGREAPQVDFAVGLLAEAGELIVDGSTVRQVEFEPRTSGEDEQLTARIMDGLRQAGAQGLTESELGELVPPDRVQGLIGFQVRAGDVQRIGRDRYYDTESLENVRGIIVRAIAERGRATPAEIRDATGLTRKYLIPILEWLDASGATVRDGDARAIGPSAPLGPRNA